MESLGEYGSRGVFASLITRAFGVRMAAIKPASLPFWSMDW